MALSWPFALAALADFTAVLVHGVIGHRVILSPLSHLPATRAFGDGDMTRRILVVTWHVVTATFACSGVAMLLVALGRLQGGSLPRVLGALHAGFVLTALVVVGRRIPATFRRPIPVAFGVCMTTVALGGWLG